MLIAGGSCTGSISPLTQTPSVANWIQRFVVKTAVGIAEYIGWGRPSPPWLMGIIDIIVVRVWEVQSLCDVFYHVVGHCCCEFSIESSFPVIPIVW